VKLEGPARRAAAVAVTVEDAIGDAIGDATVVEPWRIFRQIGGGRHDYDNLTVAEQNVSKNVIGILTGVYTLDVQEH
jgi:hypothetical protein